MASYCTVILGGMEILAHLPDWVCKGYPLIPIKGKHLDQFSFTDNAFIIINKLFTVIFVYHLAQTIYYTPSIKKLPEEATVMNTVGSLVAFYVVYDFFYANFHRILHFRSLYALIHKHHHRQKAPSRGNLDAINVHPFEYFVGEYLHLVTIYLVPCHVYAVAVFILLAGIFASLNHTRYDVVIPGLFSVKVHDVHHRLPESNYSQYTMLWDYIQGSYRAYDKVQNVKDMSE
jgi:sterol desaturase/sphingolipid hydroxylase (fatty acid hydroxylase superfamily)